MWHRKFELVCTQVCNWLYVREDMYWIFSVQSLVFSSQSLGFL